MLEQITPVSSPTPNRILFVDDDPYLLEGLRDALRPQRRQWAMTFVPGGEEALDVLAQDPHDVVVSDLRMPRMDGAELLARVRELHPTAVRIVLSGQAALEMVARAAAVAHRLLAKPCDIDDLKQVIERACTLHDLTAGVELNRRTAGASALPSLPHLYEELTELLSAGESSAEDAARIVESDMAMTAKVLQLANSAYFGRRKPVSGIREAVAYLGLDALRAFTLSAEVFQRFRIEPPIAGFDLEQLQRHCTRVATVARAIASETGAVEQVFTAGLLHDVGLLVLATQDRYDLAKLLDRARREERPLHEVEHERYGVSHGEVGAHLLALWGLPRAITDPIAHHHEAPPAGSEFGGDAAIYVANVLVEQAQAELLTDSLPASELDQDFLERADMAVRLEHWRTLAAGSCEAG